MGHLPYLASSGQGCWCQRKGGCPRFWARLYLQEAASCCSHMGTLPSGTGRCHVGSTVMPAGWDREHLGKADCMVVGPAGVCGLCQCCSGRGLQAGVESRASGPVRGGRSWRLHRITTHMVHVVLLSSALCAAESSPAGPSPGAALQGGPVWCPGQGAGHHLQPWGGQEPFRRSHRGLHSDGLWPEAGGGAQAPHLAGSNWRQGQIL